MIHGVIKVLSMIYLYFQNKILIPILKKLMDVWLRKVFGRKSCVCLLRARNKIERTTRKT